MDIEIFVQGEEDRRRAESLGANGHAPPEGAAFRVVDFTAPPTDGVPAMVLWRLLEAGGAALPITLVDQKVLLAGRLPTAEDLARAADPYDPSTGFTDCEDYVEDAVVTFPTRSRVHINLVVKDLGRAVHFYRVLLGQAPTKVREGYAKFETEDPPLNLALLEDPHGGAKGHFGIQVKATGVIRKAMTRFSAAGLYQYEEGETACCYALQDKTWVVDPEGRQWEVYAVMDNASSAGCAPDCICYRDLAPSQDVGAQAPAKQGACCAGTAADQTIPATRG